MAYVKKFCKIKGFLVCGQKNGFFFHDTSKNEMFL